MLTHALSMWNGKFDKIVWARNPIEVYGVSRLGFCLGRLKKNLAISASIDHIGIEQYETLLAQGNCKYKVYRLYADEVLRILLYMSQKDKT